jgi:hypothetical protein
VVLVNQNCLTSIPSSVMMGFLGQKKKAARAISIILTRTNTITIIFLVQVIMITDQLMSDAALLFYGIGFGILKILHPESK